MLFDILPTGFHGAVTAGVGVGSTVYIAGAGPVGMAAAASAQIWRGGGHHRRPPWRSGWPTRRRWVLRRSTSRNTTGWASRSPRFWASRWWMPRWMLWALRLSGHGPRGEAAPAAVLNRADGHHLCRGRTGDPRPVRGRRSGGVNEDAKKGMLKLRIGKGWSKSLALPYRAGAGVAVQPAIDAGDPA